MHCCCCSWFSCILCVWLCVFQCALVCANKRVRLTEQKREHVCADPSTRARVCVCVSERSREKEWEIERERELLCCVCVPVACVFLTLLMCQRSSNWAHTGRLALARPPAVSLQHNSSESHQAAVLWPLAPRVNRPQTPLARRLNKPKNVFHCGPLSGT